MIFLGFGAVQLVLQGLIAYDVVSGSGIEAANWVFMILAGVFCVITAVYCGFAMSYCKSVPFWNTGLLPFVFLIMGVADGLALDHGRGAGHRRRRDSHRRVGHPHPAHRQRPA